MLEVFCILSKEEIQKKMDKKMKKAKKKAKCVFLIFTVICTLGGPHCTDRKTGASLKEYLLCSQLPLNAREGFKVCW